MSEKKKVDMKDLTLLVVSDWKSKDGDKQAQIRVVQWVKDGKSVSAALEKREFYMDEEGTLKMGKAKGFSARDLDACKPLWANIMALLRNPPPVATEPAPADDDPGF